MEKRNNECTLAIADGYVAHGAERRAPVILIRSVLGLLLVAMFIIATGCATQTATEHAQAILDQTTTGSETGKPMSDTDAKRLSVLKQETDARIREMNEIMLRTIGQTASDGGPTIYLVPQSKDQKGLRADECEGCWCSPTGCGCCNRCTRTCYPSPTCKKCK